MTVAWPRVTDTMITASRRRSPHCQTAPPAPMLALPPVTNLRMVSAAVALAAAARPRRRPSGGCRYRPGAANAPSNVAAAISVVRGDFERIERTVTARLAQEVGMSAPPSCEKR